MRDDRGGALHLALVGEFTPAAVGYVALCRLHVAARVAGAPIRQALAVIIGRPLAALLPLGVASRSIPATRSPVLG